MKIEVNNNERLKWIDLSKGIGIILVVVGHMLRGFTSAGMYTNNLEAYKYIDFTIYSFHMPLFFILSGVLYSKAFSIKNNKEYILFILKKIKVLMIPYFVFSWIQIGIKLVMSGSVNSEVSYRNLITIFIKPIEQFWFLYALMIVFILITFIDFKIHNKNVKIIVVIIISIGIRIIPIDLGIIGVGIFNIIYFYIGRYIISIIYKVREKYSMILVLLVLYIVLNIVSYNYNITNIMIILMMALIGSVLVITICDIYISKSIKLSMVLKLLGEYSMVIYLLHTIFGSGIRIILMKLSIDNFIIQTIFGLVAGIIIPIIIAKIYKKLVCKYEK